MKLHLLGTAGALCLLLIPRPSTMIARAPDDPVEKLTAFALANNQTGSLVSTPVDITIDRWSTDDERTRLMQSVVNGGSSGFSDALADMPRAALLRPSNQLGIEFQFATHRVLKDGSDHVALMTERPLTFFEAFRSPALPEYRFTLVALSLGQDGRGEGKISLAARVMVDKGNRTIQFEDYSSQPAVMLQGVQRAGPLNPRLGR